MGPRSIALRLVPTGLAAVLAFGVASPAPAQAPPASVRLDARIGFGDDLVRERTSNPMTIKIESDALFAGSVQVTLNTPTGSVVLSQDVEVPAGSLKTFRMVLPRPDVGSVRAVDRRGRVLRSVLPSGSSFGDEIVGYLAVADPPIRDVFLREVGRDAVVVRVAQDLLDLGPDSIRALSHLVVDADLAAGFSPRQRDALLAYAAAGGELVVAASAETDLAFLPEPWRGTGGGAVRRSGAGLGTATVVMRSLRTAQWGPSGSMWQRTIRPMDLSRWRGDDLGETDWFETLSATGGFRRPPLAWLLAFILVYAALAGPVNFLVLAKLRRRELAWVTVPALAVLFAAGAYAAGRGVRSVPLVQGAGVGVVAPGGAEYTVGLGVLSRSGGVERVTFSGEWLAEPLTFIGGGPNPGSRTSLLLSRGESVARFDLAIGDIGTVAARHTRAGATEPAGRLVADGDLFEGDVTNQTGVTLRGAVVVGGQAIEHLGTLAPGRRAHVRVEDGGRFGPIAEEGFLQVFPGFINGQFGGRVPFSLVQRGARQVGLGQPGTAFLAGWADLKALGPRLGIGARPGVVMLLIPLEVGLKPGASISDVAVRRALIGADVAGAEGFDPGIPVEERPTREVTVRFTLPGGATPKHLALDTTQVDRFFRDAFGGPVPPEVKPVPDEAGAAVPLPAERRVTFEVYDWRARRWVAVGQRGGRVELYPRSGRRFLSGEGEVLVRLSSEFQTSFPLAALRMVGEAAA